MRNWIAVVLMAAVLLGIGGAVSYIVVKKLSSDTTDAATAMPAFPGMPVMVIEPGQRSGNPLLTATDMQFDMWFGRYCFGHLHYYRHESSDLDIERCLLNVGREVEASTGVRLTREQMLDPEILVRWKKMKGL